MPTIKECPCSGLLVRFCSVLIVESLPPTRAPGGTDARFSPSRPTLPTVLALGINCPLRPSSPAAQQGPMLSAVESSHACTPRQGVRQQGSRGRSSEVAERVPARGPCGHKLVALSRTPQEQKCCDCFPISPYYQEGYTTTFQPSISSVPNLPREQTGWAVRTPMITSKRVWAWAWACPPARLPAHRSPSRRWDGEDGWMEGTICPGTKAQLGLERRDRAGVGRQPGELAGRSRPSFESAPVPPRFAGSPCFETPSSKGQISMSRETPLAPLTGPSGPRGRDNPTYSLHVANGRHKNAACVLGAPRALRHQTTSHALSCKQGYLNPAWEAGTCRNNRQAHTIRTCVASTAHGTARGSTSARARTWRIQTARLGKAELIM